MSEPKKPSSQETKLVREIDEQTQKHIDRLKKGVESWNDWAKKKLAQKAELENAGKWFVKLKLDDQRYVRTMSNDPQNPMIQDWLNKTYVNFSKLSLENSFYFSNLIFPGDVNFFKVKFGEEISFSSSVFSGEANFSKASFKGIAPFIITNFKKGANFHKVEFKDTAGFIGAKFNRGTNFTEVEFNGQAAFNEAHFKEWVTFDKAIMTSSTVFNNAKFDKETSFNEVLFWGEVIGCSSHFEDEVNFKKTKFYEFADFENIIFFKDVSFREAVFKEGVNFTDVSFKKKVDYSSVSFEDQVIFSSFNVKGEANFFDTKFESWAQFHNAVFEKDANFYQSVFENQANFRQVDFKKHANFTEVVFNYSADFQAILSKRAFSLRDAKFASVIPNFTQANFAESPRLDNIQLLPAPAYKDYPFPSKKIQSPLKWQRYWWNLQFRAFLMRLFWRCVYKLTPSNYRKLYHKGEVLKHLWNKFTNKRNNPNEEAHYRALKRLAIQAHDHENEMKFFAGEICARRHVTDFANFLTHDFASSMRYWAGVAYELFSDFGRSFIRPALWWFACLWLFANLTLSNAGLEDKTKCHNSQLTPKQAAYTIGLKNSLLILGLTKTNIVKQAELCLYGVNKNGEAEREPKPYDPKIKRAYQAKSTKAETTKTDIPFKAAVQGITHSLLSLFFIFLLLLAIRNQFKIK